MSRVKIPMWNLFAWLIIPILLGWTKSESLVDQLFYTKNGQQSCQWDSVGRIAKKHYGVSG